MRFHLQRVIGTALALTVTLASQSVWALTATGNFNVQVNLFPKCEVAGPTTLALNYVSFQTTASTNTLAATVKCTNTLPYTLSLAGTSGAAGTLLGLNYTLALPSGAQTGTGAVQTQNITGTIAANQGGTCATVQTATTGTQVAGVTGAAVGLGTACTGTSAAGAHILTVTY